jgi:hypothetical protein
MITMKLSDRQLFTMVVVLPFGPWAIALFQRGWGGVFAFVVALIWLYFAVTQGVESGSGATTNFNCTLRNEIIRRLAF